MTDENVGKNFGIYTILSVDEKTQDSKPKYICRCNICHGIFHRRLDNIKIYNKECRHMNVHWENLRIRRTFKAIVQRCYNSNLKDYKWYGGKGISVCQEWMDNPKLFEIWALNNGYADDLTIDRIDSNKEYCPENCRWIPLEENSRRAGKVTWLTVDGITLTGRQWSEKFGLGINRINTYIRQYGIDKVKELLAAMLNSPPQDKIKNKNQSWFKIYNIQI